MSTPNAPSGDQSDSIGRLADLIGDDPMAALDTDMRAVVDMLAQLGAGPLEQLTPEAARRQPALIDAVTALVARQHRTPPVETMDIEDVVIAGAAGELQARLYRPEGLLGRLNPMVLYFHGGGFVTGDLDSHDGSARALARRSGAIVVSVDYRLAPEHDFPAAHDDAWAAWTWLGAQAHKLGGDPRRVAVIGEDAGGNLALHVALMARQARGHRPIHQVLIHPIADTDLTTPSYDACLRARPIGLPAMRWRLRQLFPDGVPKDEPRLQLARRADLAGLAPTSLVLAGVDPLTSEGEALALALQQAGSSARCLHYDGVTQGFFGLGQIVTKALFAQADVADALAKAFVPPPSR